MLEIQQRGFSIRIYEDSRPHCYKSTGIQKGLILVYNNQEVSGEGIGFGAPVVKYADKTYFASEATLSSQKIDEDLIITKKFYINSIFRFRLFGKYIKSQLLDKFTKSVSKIHRKNEKSRILLDPIFAIVRKIMGRPSDLVYSSNKGNISVSYHIGKESINIHIDMSELDKVGCEEICIMNEQSADFFRKYNDSDGNLLIDDKIPSWKMVSAEKARFADINDKISFELVRLPETKLYLGREKFEGHLAWTGFAYCISSEIDEFDYNIRLESK